MTRNVPRIMFFASIVLLVAALAMLNIQDFMFLEAFKNQSAFLSQFYLQHKVPALGIYFLIIFLLTALSIPGLALLMLIGGALFDFSAAVLLVSCADVLGSAAAFLMSRHLFRKRLQTRHGSRLTVVNRGIEQEGAFYLLSLRLMPLFPCFLINLVMGLTRIRLSTFCWVTQVGKLPHNTLYVNAGTQISQITSVREIASPGLLFAFILLGCFPLIARKAMGWHRKRHPNVCWLETVDNPPQP